MIDSCPGPPPAAAGNGGMRQQLTAMRDGFHPVTGLLMPEPSGSSARGRGTYSMLRATNIVTEGFTPYVPAVFKPAVSSGCSAERKRWLMKGRILCKLSSEAAKRKRRRRKEVKAEVDCLVSSFIAAAGVGSRTNIGTHDRMIEDEQSDEDFWTSLPTMANQDRTHVREIPSQAVRAYPGRTVKTRTDALNAAALHSKDK